MGTLAVWSQWHDGQARLVAVREYVAGKQEIRDIFGGKSVQIEPTLRFWLHWHPAANGVREKFFVNSISSLMTLDVVMRRDDGVWRILEASLINASNDHKRDFSPVHVEGVQFFAASTSSAPLKTPVYAEGEDVHVVVVLGGLAALPVGTVLRESINIFDRDNTLVAEIKDVTKSSPTGKSDSMRFSSLIAALSAGKYSVQFLFKGPDDKELDSYWQEISIKKISQEIIVKSVRYYADAGRSQRQADPEYQMGGTIYFTILADGFRVSSGKIAGTVDLVVKDERGTVLINKPHFVAFNQDYKPGHDVVVNGEIKMVDSGLYLFEFVLNDYFTKRQLTQVEKITIVREKSAP